MGTNGLLSRLPAKERDRLTGECAAVDLRVGELLVNAGSSIAHVYLPTTCYISILGPIDGNHVEVALAGHEGMFGWALGLDADISEVTALVQGGGCALRLRPAAFKRQIAQSDALRDVVNRYTHVLMTQFALTAGCNRFHVVEQRLSRWLLATADRARSHSFRITQVSLAEMLGVRRPGVTEAAQRLQRHGLISYRRGALTILDRPRLERAACSCYRMSKRTYSRILG